MKGMNTKAKAQNWAAEAKRREERLSEEWPRTPQIPSKSSSTCEPPSGLTMLQALSRGVLGETRELSNYAAARLEPLLPQHIEVPVELPPQNGFEAAPGFQEIRDGLLEINSCVLSIRRLLARVDV